jgi:ribosomal protein L37E
MSPEIRVLAVENVKNQGIPGEVDMYCRSCGEEVQNPGSFCSSCGSPLEVEPGKRNLTFQEWRRKRILYLMILCAVAIPVGFLLNNLVVSALAAVGLVGGAVKLSMMS